MEIMESSSAGEADVKEQVPSAAPEEKKDQDGNKDDGKKENVFSDERLMVDSLIMSLMDGGKERRISPRDKIAFIDAVASNERFTKDYSLFGGKLTLTVRSLTSDEVNALASWTAKQGTKDSAGLMAGRYRKYLVAAHVAMLNGVEMPPLEEPLYERLGADGKTVDPPGWIKRSDYWDGMGYGQFQAIVKCLQNFDVLYSALCEKAEDANFWNPDTP